MQHKQLQRVTTLPVLMSTHNINFITTYTTEIFVSDQTYGRLN